MQSSDIEQRTDAWKQLRLGKVTASRIADVCAKTKTGWGAARANYLADLVCERLTGEPASSFCNAAMQWGIDTEPRARASYEFITGNAVTEIGFVDHPSIPMTGASPDGRVGDAGMVEIKCPNTATHIKTVTSETIDRKYLLQMQWQMECDGRDWCDFVSFDPRLPSEMQMWVKRIERDDALLAETRETVSEFLAEVDETIATLRARFDMEQAAA